MNLVLTIILQIIVGSDEVYEAEEEKAEGSDVLAEIDDEYDLEKFQSMENHDSKCNIDYRLQTLQDLGRYQKNNPGAYYDHNENSWFCATCINFSGIRKKGTAWVDKGVRLGNNPGKAFRRHFESEFHLKNVNFKKLFGSIRSDEKSNVIVGMLTKFKVLSDESKKKKKK